MGKFSKITLKNEVEVTKLCYGHFDEVQKLEKSQNFWTSLNAASAKANVQLGAELYIKWYCSLAIGNFRLIPCRLETFHETFNMPHYPLLDEPQQKSFY